MDLAHLIEMTSCNIKCKQLHIYSIYVRILCDHEVIGIVHRASDEPHPGSSARNFFVDNNLAENYKSRTYKQVATTK